MGSWFGWGLKCSCLNGNLVLGGVGLESITQASSGRWGAPVPGTCLLHVGLGTVFRWPLAWPSRKCILRHDCYEPTCSSFPFVCPHSSTRRGGCDGSRFGCRDVNAELSCDGYRFGFPIRTHGSVSFKSWDLLFLPRLQVCAEARNLFCVFHQWSIECFFSIGQNLWDSILRKSSLGLASSIPASVVLKLPLRRYQHSEDVQWWREWTWSPLAW